MGLAVCIEDRGEAAVLLLFFMAGVEGMEEEDLNRDMIMCFLGVYDGSCGEGGM